MTGRILTVGKDALIWLAVVLSSILLLGLVAIGFLMWVIDSGCGNDVAFEKPSPSGAYKAVVFDRNCGATTPYYTHISILKGTEKLTDSMKGNCAGFRGQTSGIDFDWKSDQELVIELAKQPLTKKEYCGEVHVTYRIGP